MFYVVKTPAFRLRNFSRKKEKIKLYLWAATEGIRKKIVLFLMAVPLRGGGGLGKALAIKTKKNFFGTFL